jgi:putative sporulation protein YtaF
MLYIILEALTLALAISLDTLVVSIGYGTSKIKIPFASAFVMSFFNIVVLSFSIFIGSLVGDAITEHTAKIISFSVLLAVGLFKFLSELIKIFLARKAKKGQVKLKILGFRLILSVIADSRQADLNKDKKLSPIEALTLGLILSIDSIGVGLSIGIMPIYLNYVIIFSFLLPLIFIPIGSFIGKKLSGKINLSWLSGLILIALAITKLF